MHSATFSWTDCTRVGAVHRYRQVAHAAQQRLEVVQLGPARNEQGSALGDEVAITVGVV